MKYKVLRAWSEEERWSGYDTDTIYHLEIEIENGKRLNFEDFKPISKKTIQDRINYQVEAARNERDMDLFRREANKIEKLYERSDPKKKKHLLNKLFKIH